jgi:hypothetical protein
MGEPMRDALTHLPGFSVVAHACERHATQWLGEPAAAWGFITDQGVRFVGATDYDL